ncbi:signal peptidase I [uncultured Dokdonia sp.]|uniref:signal peptidase I n=1 Tax=uncultured Dokdonia sp. TaxID=575653 RepID=UPI00262E6BB9|nr:signal peptidase I [uncultured Dokdonia sp.]
MSRKKKILLGIVIAFFGLFVIYTVLGSKGYFKVYAIPTTSSSPTLEPGDYIIVSNLIPVKNNDHIVFERFDKTFGFGYYVSRLVAKEGDTFSIRNGIAYVNNVNIDSSIRIKHAYKMHIDILKELHSPEYYTDYYQISKDSIIIHLEDKVAEAISPKASKQRNINFGKVHESFPEEWNYYNFGPLIIPENKLFVLGNNRDNSQDSRYFGLIEERNYIGKAINVH